MSDHNLVESLNRLNEGAASALETHKSAIESLTDRVERIESVGDRPKGTVSPTESKIERQHREEFTEWLRRPGDNHRKNRLAEVQSEIALDRKDFLAGSGTGAFAIPEQIASEITKRVTELNPFRGLVRVDQSSTGDYKALLDLSDSVAGWTAETGSRSLTGTPNLRERTPTGAEMYAYPTCSEWALQDAVFDVENWLVSSAGQAFAELEHQSIITGSGSNQPTGFLNTTPVATADTASPQRDADALELVTLASPASPASLNFDSMVELMTTVKSGYLTSPSCAWVMHRTTYAALKQIKDSQGAYIFSADPAQAGAGTILGFPIVLSDYMPVYGTDNNIIAFGDWQRGYLLVDRMPNMSVTVDPYSSPGMIRFYVRRRVFGTVMDNNAVKVLALTD